MIVGTMDVVSTAIKKLEDVPGAGKGKSVIVTLLIVINHDLAFVFIVHF